MSAENEKMRQNWKFVVSNKYQHICGMNILKNIIRRPS
jgi:hypothetical protein